MNTTPVPIDYSYLTGTTTDYFIRRDPNCCTSPYLFFAIDTPHETRPESLPQRTSASDRERRQPRLPLPVTHRTVQSVAARMGRPV